MIRTIAIGDPDYPKELDSLGNAAPLTFSVEGDFTFRGPRVAIVGARKALDVVAAFVKRLAGAVVAADGVVISGGALGVDTAAHEGALEAGGRTWSVLGCGAPHTTPPENEKLFPRILKGGGAIIRPFPDETTPLNSRFLKRNGVLVALAQVVVVAQAGLRSGTMNSAIWATDLERPLWIVPGPPWHDDSFEGSWHLIEKNKHATIFKSERAFIENVLHLHEKPPRGLTDDEMIVWNALESGAKHPDELTVSTGLPTSAVTSALLTLALGNVVVEGGAGLFQRKKLISS